MAYRSIITKDWHPDSWRNYDLKQQPKYKDEKLLKSTIAKLSKLPPLVTSWEVESLKQKISRAQQGKAFVLQGGDCSENFEECTSEIVVNKLKILLQMSLVMAMGFKKPIIRIGRMAGQYAKPRSDYFEAVHDQTLPSYRGDMINRLPFTSEAREPDPLLLLRGYERAALTLNFVRSLIDGGFADLHHPENWDLNFVNDSPMANEYQSIVRSVSDSLQFFESVAGEAVHSNRVEFYSSHEGLHLDYEQAQTRYLEHRQKWYNLTTHFPWIGLRTAALDGAHVEYFRGISNPIGVKVGPGFSNDHMQGLLEALNPMNEAGRLCLITRFGADNVETHLPRIIKTVQNSGNNVLWICDPMHGNTEKTASGIKTRRFDKIMKELELSFQIHQENGSYLGGAHLELTGDNVTECIGGARNLKDTDLNRSYKTQVDPRLNYEQAMEIALRCAGNFGRD